MLHRPNQTICALGYWKHNEENTFFQIFSKCKFIAICKHSVGVHFFSWLFFCYSSSFVLFVFVSQSSHVFERPLWCHYPLVNDLCVGYRLTKIGRVTFSFSCMAPTVRSVCGSKIHCLQYFPMHDGRKVIDTAAILPLCSGHCVRDSKYWQYRQALHIFLSGKLFKFTQGKCQNIS